MTVTLGIDIGGTFTDVVASDGERTWIEKVRSTPSDPCEAISAALELLADRGMPTAGISAVAHGTTVATNAILEGRGATTALVTTAGFRDVLEIGRLRVPELYNMLWDKPPPLVPRRLRFEISERVGSDGELERPVDEQEIGELASRLRECDVESVAIALINAHTNPHNERRAAELLRAALPGKSVSTSYEVLPEIKEFERTSTTVVNAYVKPRMARYVGELSSRLVSAGVTAPLYIMQSSGGLTTPDLAAEFPVTVIESGPAAGLLAAARLSESLGLDRALSFDMGGTTAKAALIEGGALRLSSYYEVGGEGSGPAGGMFTGRGYPISIPSLEISEVGSGGGSIAWVDDGGVLKVGPRSAGASPGPACYGRGGEAPTVTDAHVVLGYLDPTNLSDPSLPADAALAFAAFRDHLCARLGVGVQAAARAVLDIANTQMMRAIRSVTVEKGKDPSSCALIAFGGAGPVHAAGVADRIGIEKVIVPPLPGLFSALGLIAADVQLTASKSFQSPLDEALRAGLQSSLEDVETQLEARFTAFSGGDRRLHHMAEARLAGQSHALLVDLEAPVTSEGLERFREEFEQLYEETYGYQVGGRPVELTKLVLSMGVANPRADLLGVIHQSMESRFTNEQSMPRKVHWSTTDAAIPTPVVSREDLEQRPQAGPLLVQEYDTVVLVPPMWNAAIDDRSNILLERTEER